MNTAQALALLGITDATLTRDQREAFDRDGFFLAENVFTAEEVAIMRAEFDRLRELEGEFGGHEVHIEPGAPRLSNLFNKSHEFDRCLRCKPTLAAAHSLFGEIHTYSMNARNPSKGEGQQPLHSDVPRVHPNDWRAVNSMVMLDDMTLDNGPTRVVPGSHKWSPLNVPEVNLAEVTHQEIDAATRPRVPADPWAPYPGEVYLTGKAGSVGVINGCLWHSGTRNRSGAPRRVLHLAIARRDVPQQHVERDHLTPELLERSTPAMRYLLDIEDAEPKVFGYPPLPDRAATWVAIGAEGQRY
jgi:ectoine hydroxylase-related dioxygenase (phytanoyl-CoA dioxygenase family)